MEKDIKDMTVEELKEELRRIREERTMSGLKKAKEAKEEVKKGIRKEKVKKQKEVEAEWI